MELSLTDGSNFGAIAKAMGMTADIKQEKKSTLARLKISHQGIDGETVIKGKSTKYKAVEPGSYVLELPNGVKLYQKDPKIRLFMQRFMYKKYVQNGDGSGKYVKSIMAEDFKSDLPDTDGGFNCGRRTGYVEDYDSLSQEEKDLIKQVKRTRVILGEIKFNKAINEQGEELDCSNAEDVPFIWEVENKDAFKTMGALVASIASKGKFLPQYWVGLDTVERSIASGMTFYLPEVDMDLSEEIDMTDEDTKKLKNFVMFVDDYNAYVHKESGGQLEHTAEVISIEEPKKAKIEDVQVKEPKKKAKAETAKVPPKKKDLGNVLTRWASDDEQ